MTIAEIVRHVTSHALLHNTRYTALPIPGPRQSQQDSKAHLTTIRAASNTGSPPPPPSRAPLGRGSPGNSSHDPARHPRPGPRLVPPAAHGRCVLQLLSVRYKRFS